MQQTSQVQIFREEQASGRLMKATPDPVTRFKYQIWFDYTRDLINKIHEGDCVAVPNFDISNQKWSVLQIINALPLHYAIGTDLKGYPGFLMESAKSASIDWTEQETESYEDTTKIVCDAVPMNLELIDVPGIENIDQIKLYPESSMPMVGKEAKLLHSDLMKKLINKSIQGMEDIFTLGTLIRDDRIDLQVRVDELVKTHFGLFGYTGVGKSNLISTLISKLLNESRQTIKIVLFDLNGEYLGLIIDQMFTENTNSRIICIGHRTLPGPVFRYINRENRMDHSLQNEAVEAYLRTMLLPKGLRSEKANYKEHLRKILVDDKISIYEPVAGQVCIEFIRENKRFLYTSMDGIETTNQMQEVEEILQSHRQEILNGETAETIISELENFTSSGNIRSTVKSRVEGLIKQLQKVVEFEEESPLTDQVQISVNEIVNDLNNEHEENNSLYIVTGHDPNEIRRFAKRLGLSIYEDRRETGVILPLALFIFDEADEFIPSSPTGTYEDSTEVIETLARRGRKFGIGVGIATQRVTYLNTSIMAQPHTYFVSKLPRKEDRGRVAEAFAISEDMFTQTFKFQPGNWLLVSHDATGLEAVPIPIKVGNAEDRIKNFLIQNNETDHRIKKLKKLGS